LPQESVIGSCSVSLHPIHTYGDPAPGMGLDRGNRKGGSPVGRAGHSRARRSSSHVPAIVFREDTGPSCGPEVWAQVGATQKTASQATGPAAPQLLHHEPSRAVSPPPNPVPPRGPGNSGATPTLGTECQPYPTLSPGPRALLSAKSFPGHQPH
jgi:hypothetical protein